MTRRIKFILVLSRLFLWLETALLVTLPAFIFLGIAYIIIASGLFYGVAAKSIFILTILISTVSILRKASLLRWPLKEKVERRIELASQLNNRPFTQIEDTPATSSSDHVMWQQAVQTARSNLRKARIAWPHPQLAKKDIFAIRNLIFLILIVTIIVTKQEGLERLKDALPFPESLVNQPLGDVDFISITLTPPPYTGQAATQITTATLQTEPVKVPKGSIVEIRIPNQGFIKPRVKINNMQLPIQKIDKSFYVAQTAVQNDTTLSVLKLPFLGDHFKIKVTPDLAPEISITKPPRILANGLLQFYITLRDDYGVKALKIRLHAKDGPHWLAPEDHLEYLVLLNSGRGKQEDISPVFDFTWHPQAGKLFDITISALDDLGQETVLASFPFTVPERKFREKSAKLIAEFRRDFIDDSRLSSARRLSRELEEILSYPDLFEGKLNAFLGLRIASNILSHTTKSKELAESVSLIWQSALSLEGDAANTNAMKNLIEAQKKLAQIMGDKNATPEEIQQALDEYKQALMESFQTLIEQMQTRTDPQSALSRLSPDLFSKLATPQSIDDFLEQMKEALQNGDKEKAAQLFSQIQKMMDGLSSGAQGGMPEGTEAMAKGLEELQALIDRQQDLLSQTESQKALQLQGKTIDTRKNTVEQDALRFILGQLMRELGEDLPSIPENLGLAEQAMRNASASLKENMPKLAAPFQQKALVELQKSKNNIQQQLKLALENMMLLTPSAPSQRDALGRDSAQGLSSERLNIPKESARRKIQDIIEQLREKSGDRSRPKEERDYYLRLLKQF